MSNRCYAEIMSIINDREVSFDDRRRSVLAAINAASGKACLTTVDSSRLFAHFLSAARFELGPAVALQIFQEYVSVSEVHDGMDGPYYVALECCIASGRFHTALNLAEECISISKYVSRSNWLVSVAALLGSYAAAMIGQIDKASDLLDCINDGECVSWLEGVPIISKVELLENIARLRRTQ